MENSSKTIKLVPFKEVKPITLKEMNKVFKMVEKIPKKLKISANGLKYNDLRTPNEDGKPRSHFELLEETHRVALPKLLGLMNKYPNKTFISIGMTSEPVKRDIFYNGFSAYIRRDSLVPKLKIDDQILFRTRNKFNALMVEYLLQFHIAEGLWKDHFINRVNPHCLRLPKLPEDEQEAKDYYVYAKFSTQSATFSTKTRK
jgi:hypothetical protein